MVLASDRDAGSATTISFSCGDTLAPGNRTGLPLPNDQGQTTPGDGRHAPIRESGHRGGHGEPAGIGRIPTRRASGCTTAGIVSSGNPDPGDASFAYWETRVTGAANVITTR